MEHEASSTTPPDEPRPFDLDVFEQLTHWTTRDGTTLTIAELDEPSRANLAAWLMANARHFYLQALPLTITRTIHADDAIPDMVFQRPDEWLRDTPLYQVLTHTTVADLYGPFCSADRAIAKLGLNNLDELKDLATAGELLLLPTADDNTHICPIWQFTNNADGTHWGTRHAARAMLIHMRDLDPWGTIALLCAPAPELDDQTPRDLMRTNPPPIAALESLARRFVHEMRA
ncbi:MULTISPECIES: hypothetical protein [unclassified Aeromicrobium]|uniref:hypothetical protein n=1 Tax=unclassified Aeromicrobium TaxID=2633570 RepID=UPI00288BC1E7|nr:MULTISPECIES: hypothetical protein [unclassified Aeromicrobium]